MIQVIDSIPWVRCASGNVFFRLLLNFFSPFFNFQNWPLGGATYISCKFDQQVGLLASVANLAIRWPCLHQLQIWPPGGATCIATLPWIALLASSVCIELVSSSARVTSVKSQQGVVLTSRHIDRTPGIPGSDKNICLWVVVSSVQHMQKNNI